MLLFRPAFFLALAEHELVGRRAGLRSGGQLSAPLPGNYLRARRLHALLSATLKAASGLRTLDIGQKIMQGGGGV